MRKAEEILERAEVLYLTSSDAVEIAQKLLEEAFSRGWNTDHFLEARQLLTKKLRKLNREIDREIGSIRPALRFMVKSLITSIFFLVIASPLLIMYLMGNLSETQTILLSIPLAVVYTLIVFMYTGFPFENFGKESKKIEDLSRYAEIREALKIASKALRF